MSTIAPRTPEHPEPLGPPTRAQVDLFTSDLPDLSGSVTFQALPPDGVRVDAEILGLEPGSVHGLQLREATDCDDFAAESPHFDGIAAEGEPPRPHGDPNQLDSHLGDLGNLTADADGHAQLISRVRGLLTVGVGGPFDIVGHVLVLQRAEDDFISDSPDNSGGLLACGRVDLLPAE